MIVFLIILVLLGLLPTYMTVATYFNVRRLLLREEENRIMKGKKK